MEVQLEQTLLGCSQPNTEVIRQSELALKKLLVGSKSISPLIRLIRFSTHQAVRQLASVLLRVKLATLNWMKLPFEEQEACKSMLLECVLMEPIRQIKICNCYAVAALAKSQLAQPNGWPALIQLIHQTTAASTPEHNEIGFLLMYTLTESLATYYAESMGDFVQIYQSALERQPQNGGGDARVILSVLRATAAMIEQVSEDESVLKFQPLISMLLQALSYEPSSSSAAVEDEFHSSTMILIIETLLELTQSPHPVLVGGPRDVILALTHVIRRSTTPTSIRTSACQTLSELIQEQSRLVSKDREVRDGCLQVCLQLCRDASTLSNKEEDEEEEDTSLLEMAEQVVNAFATSLPTKIVVDTLLHIAAQMISQQEEAGLIVLIVATEGMASELMEEQYATSFSSLLRLVVSSLTSSNRQGMIRHGLLLLGQWAEHLWPLMEPHYKELIPVGISFAQFVQKEKIFTPACVLLQQYCASMEEVELDPFVPGIVQAMFHFFHTVPLAQEESLRRVLSAMETLSYLCSGSSGPAFAPYFDQVLSIVAPLMNFNGEEENLKTIRSHATALMGQLAFMSTKCAASTHGTNPFLVFVPDIVQRCLHVLQSEPEDLDFKDSAHHLFANLAQTLSTDIDVFLPQILPLVMRDCISNDGDVVKTVQSRDGDGVLVSDSLKQLAMEDENDGDSDPEDEEDPNTQVLTSVRESAADSKASAFMCLETICEVFINSLFDCQKLQQTVLVDQIHAMIKDLCCYTLDEYLHPGVRKNAMSCLPQVLLLAMRAEAPKFVPNKLALMHYAQSTCRDVDLDLMWLPGQSVSSQFPHTVELAKTFVLPHIAEGMTCDLDKEVSAEACNALVRIISFSGLTLVDSMEEDLVEALVCLLEGKGSCQRHGEQLEDDDDDDDDAAERRHDEILLDCVIEAVVILCKAMGRERCSRFMPMFVNPLVKRSKVSMPVKDRITTVGCLCMLVPLGLDITKANKMASIAMQSINQEEDMCLRRNGIVLMGMLLEHHPGMNALEALNHVMFLFSSKTRNNLLRSWEIEDLDAVLDNACSLVAKIIKLPSVPDNIKANISVELLKHLPLRFDHEEDWTVYSALLLVVNLVDPEVVKQQMVPLCFSALASVITTATSEHKGKLPLGTADCLVQLGEACGQRLGGDLPQELIAMLVETKQKVRTQWDLQVA